MNVFSLFADLTLDDKKFNQGLDRADSRLSQFQGRLNAFGQRVQRVGGMLSTRLTAPITAVGGAALVAAGNLGQTADKLLDLEQQTGLSTDTLQEFENVARTAGVESTTLARAAEGLTRRLRAGGDESATFTDSMAAIGVETRTASGEMRSMDDLMPEIIGRLGDMDSITERNAVSMQVFGRSATDLAPVLALGSDEIERLSQEAHSMGQVMDRDALEAANNYRIGMEQLKAEVGLTGREVTQSLLPVMGTLVQVTRDRVVPWIQALADRIAGAFEWFSELSEGTQRFVGIAVAGLGAAGPVVMAVGAATRAVSGLIGVVRTLRTLMLLASGPAGWITLLASAVGVGLVTAWNKNRKAMNEAVEKTNAVRDALGKANDRQALRSVVNDLANDLGENVRPEFVALADQAIATAGDVEEAAEQIGRAWAMAAHSRELAALEQQQARVQAEITRLEAMADDSLANIEDRIASIEAEANKILHETPVLAATPDTEEYRRVMDLMARVQQLRMEAAGVEAAVFSEEEAERLERMRADLADLEATREELISGSTFEIAGAANIETTVIPDPETGGTDADPTGLKGLGDEPINVEVRVTRTGDDPVGLPVSEAGADGVYVGRYTRESRRANARANAARFGTSGARGAYTDHARNFGASGLPVPSPTAGGPAPVTLDVPDARAFGEGVGLGITPILDILSDPFAVERRDAFMRDQARYGDGAAATENARRQTIAMGGGVSLGVSPQAGSPQAVGLPVPEPTATGQVEAPKWIQQAGNAAKSFGQSVLDAATDKVPALSGAIEGFAGGGGPLGALAGVFSSLLGESEAFQNILGMVNKAFEPIVGILDTLFQALTPIVEVAVALFQTALQPLVAIIENVVAPVFTAVGNVIKGVWNAVVRALNVLPWVNIPLIGEGGGDAAGGRIGQLEERRQDLLEDRANATSESQIQTLNRQIADIDEELRRLRNLGLEDEEDAGGVDTGAPAGGGREAPRDPVTFGGTPQGVQLAVAVPIMDAAELSFDAAQMMHDSIARVLDAGGPLDNLANLEGQVFDEHASAMREHSEVMRRWVEDPIRIDVRTGNSGGGSRTAFLRGA